MNSRKLPLIFFFNILLAFTDIVLLSGAMSFSGGAKLVILGVSVLVFLVANYLLLSSAFKKPVLKDKDNANAGSYESVLKGWKSMNTPFGKQIDIALRQLEQLETRKSKLKALSADNTFEAAVDEVQSNMFANFNRIINKLLICDKSDNVDVSRTLAYINAVLSNNAQCLEVFRKFIDEIAMMGDTDMNAQNLSLKTITDSLREIRTNGASDDDI